MSKRSLSAAESSSVAKKARMSVAANGFSKSAAGQDIDEDLHSRQLAVYGRDSMRRLAASKILILGANGLAVEVGTPHRVAEAASCLSPLPCSCLNNTVYL